MKLIIDSSILIDYLRGGIKWEELLRSLEKDTEIYLPTIVIFELFSGKSTTNRHISKAIHDFIKKFQRIDLTEKIAVRAALLYRDISKNLGAPDYIIAATALEVHGTVVTLNRKHFELIPTLTLYPI